MQKDDVVQALKPKFLRTSEHISHLPWAVSLKINHFPMMRGVGANHTKCLNQSIITRDNSPLVYAFPIGKKHVPSFAHKKKKHAKIASITPYKTPAKVNVRVFLWDEHEEGFFRLGVASQRLSQWAFVFNEKMVAFELHHLWGRQGRTSKIGASLLINMCSIWGP